MRNIILGIFILLSAYGQAQLYVLKDHRPDTAEKINVIYDSLPAMCDTFYRAFLTQNLSSLKPFVPQVKYLRATFDTLAIEYRPEQVLYRQQLMLRLLQKDYKKALKYAEKNKIHLKKIVLGESSYDYATDEKGNRYCYVTVLLTRRKNTYELKYLAIVLNGHWFVGDELTFKEIE
tara:strand:+ start:42 stop:569 length:528 start_codon:yes stop_codon:yes gene_type:complete